MPEQPERATLTVTLPELDCLLDALYTHKRWCRDKGFPDAMTVRMLKRLTAAHLPLIRQKFPQPD